MSGLLERIARRRRASAGSRLGLPSQNSNPQSNGTPHPAGGPPSHGVAEVNGSPADHIANGAVGAPAQAHTTAPAQPAQAQTEVPAAEPADDKAPATTDPQPAANPGFVERGRMRRRARYLRKLREIQMRDIGGFLLELHRFGRQRPDLVEAKIAGAAQTDRELRALERALGEQQVLRELREPGLGGACPTCGAVHGSADRFCASCGEALNPRGRPHDA